MLRAHTQVPCIISSRPGNRGLVEGRPGFEKIRHAPA
ncbi:hypothetical protein DP49_5710 [Burkholderia pseudomallei]|nr:hypothetical protein DP49_5710 [Burkholderia pseudomallei]